MYPFLHPSGDDVLVDLFVQPRASRNEIIGIQGNELKIRLTSPPVEGAANKLCCEFFAKLLGVSKGSVRLASGEKSRHKRLLLESIAVAEVAERLTPHL